MILTSFRCYMNAIIPMTDKETLLGTHYYILDSTEDRFSNSIEYDLQGEMKINTPRCNNNYRIEYCPDIFNPQPHTSSIQYIGVPGGDCIENKQVSYIKHLMNSDTKYKVYNKLFAPESVTEYPKMLIMFDEKNIVDYGPIIAVYMSSVFGVDIQFMDEALRPNIFGIKDGFYPGDVEQGKKTIRECKNAKLKKDIELMISETSREDTISNLIASFSNYTTEDLIYIYNSIFPDKPLYAGMYTKEDMFKILTGTICDEIDFKPGFSYDDINESIGHYEKELSDYELLEELDRIELLQEASDAAGD